MIYELAPHVGVADGAVIGAHGDRLQIAEGPRDAAVAGHLAHGPASRADLARALPDAPSAELDALLRTLVDAGLATATPAPLTAAAAARWVAIGVPAVAAAALAEARPLRTSGAPPPGLATALASWGLHTAPSGGALALVVSTPERLLGARPAAVARLVVVPLGGSVGVTFVPAHAPLPAALLRLAMNRGATRLAPPRTGRPALPDALAPALAEIVAHVVSGRPSPADGALAVLSTGAPTTRWPLPPSAAPAEPVRSDVHPLDRPPPPPARALGLLHPTTGLAHSPREVGRLGPAVAFAVRHRVAAEATTVADLKRFETRAAGGKGWTAADALASAIWEAAERVSGRRDPTRPTRTTTAHALGADALLPQDLDLVSDRQRDAPTRPEHPFLLIPDPLDPDRPVDWVRAWALDRSRPDRWVPAACVYYGYDPADHPYALAHSNGCAGGPTYAAAALAGLLEVVERDAVAIFHYSRSRRPAAAEALLDRPHIAAVRAALEARGRTLGVLDLTHDLRVPVYAAVSRRADGPPGWTLGFGAALDPADAVERAVLELAQLVPTTDSQHGSPLPWAGDDDAGAHLVPDPSAPATTPPPPTGPPLADALDRLSRAGFEAFVVDQTHPLVGVPTLKVLVPGLLFFWRRFGGGRVGHVPAALGWRPDVVPERRYNPHDLPL